MQSEKQNESIGNPLIGGVSQDILHCVKPEDGWYIPKIIHFVWFGRNPYSRIVEICIESWKEHLPDYRIQIWNEDSFPIHRNAYVKEAYEAKKWAFVSDYVRLYALYHYGGVYIDSDVEILQNLDGLLAGEHAVTGYEDKLWIPAAVMAAEKGNPWIKMLLDYYKDRHFIRLDGSMDLKPNTAVITELTKQTGFRMGDSVIRLGNVRLYPTEYFQPYKKQQFDMKDETNLRRLYSFYDINDDFTYAIHHCTGTWSDAHGIFKEVKAVIRKVLPQNIVEWMRGIYYRFHRWR